jgi:uncharacterized membrane protein YeaQ/YmgE (transglycosylase-associated protein family)
MAIIGFLILGLIAGAIARLLVPGRDPIGWVGTIVLGCVGALVGGFLGRAIFNDNNGVGLFGAVVGAVICLLIYNAVAKPRNRVGARR